MTFSEFRALLGCTGSLIMAVVKADRDALNRVEAKVNRIHAQISARKRAGLTS
jgi:hypothetical protein